LRIVMADTAALLDGRNSGFYDAAREARTVSLQSF
jgi:hypothetical protein